MKRQTYIQGELFDDMTVEDKPLVIPEANAAFDDLFYRLAQSKFRSSFHLTAQDVAYIRKNGLDKIRLHAAR